MADADARVPDGGVGAGGRTVTNLPNPGTGEEGTWLGPTGRAVAARAGAAVPVAAPAAYAGVSGLRKAAAGPEAAVGGAD